MDFSKSYKYKIEMTGNHRYKLDGDYVDGVTTVTNRFPKGYLAPWAAKMAVESIRNEWEPGKPFQREFIDAALAAAKNAHVLKRDTAADKGTLAHGILESFLKSGCEVKPPKHEDEQVQSAVDNFFEWYESNRVRFVASELAVGSKIHGFCGTLDALAYIDGEFCLVDFKTSNQIDATSFYCQTAAYQIGVEECFAEGTFGPIKARWILRFPKDGSKPECVKVPSPIEYDKDMFLATLRFHRGLKHYDQYDKFRR